MTSQHAIDDLYETKILEDLRSRTARLEWLVRLLVVAVAVLFSALTVDGEVGGAGTATQATPPSTVGPHGSYCLSDRGTVYLSSLGSDGLSFREFERWCENVGGEVLWRP